MASLRRVKKAHLTLTDRELLFFHATHDRDGDGNITRKEFIEMLTTMGLLAPLGSKASRAPAAPDGEVTAVVEVNVPGKAEDDEEEEEPIDDHTKACKVFDAMDVDNSGELSANEFVEAYHRCRGMLCVSDEPSAQQGGAEEDSDLSKLTITAIKWWPGAARESELATVEFTTYDKDVDAKARAALDSVSAFINAAPPAGGAGAGGGDGGAASVWIDVAGPQHQATLDWLKQRGLECATKQAFREEGVWYKGALKSSLWGGAPPPPAAGGAAPARAAAAPRPYVGATVPALWLANTPFKMGSSRALGFCKRRLAAPDAGAQRKRHSLNWLCCGSREGTVFVNPHEANHNRRDVDEDDSALAIFWAKYVQRYSKGDKNMVHDAPAEAPGAAAAPAAKKTSRRLLRLASRKHQEEAEGLIEAMVRGGEFHVVSKSHLRGKTPFFVRNLVGVFNVAASDAGEPALLVTVRPTDELGVVTTVLDGFRSRVASVKGFVSARVVKATGREGREEKFVKSLDGPLLGAAIVDSLGVRYNDLTFRLLEHWAAVLDVCVHEQPSSLHQRHMNKLAGLAESLKDYTEILNAAQRQLTGEKAQGGKQEFFDVFLRRAAHLDARADRLKARVAQLQDQYKTRLDEDRNWMVTALTLFTAGTWPLSFLTGYFGMCVQFTSPPPPLTRARAAFSRAFTALLPARAGTSKTWPSWVRTPPRAPPTTRTRPSRAWPACEFFGSPLPCSLWACCFYSSACASLRTFGDELNGVWEGGAGEGRGG
jgi:hypothetical protein